MIAAEGEKKASGALREASQIISESPAALQLRYLQVNITKKYEYKNWLFQTLNSVSAEKNSTIIFPLPIDMVTSLMARG